MTTSRCTAVISLAALVLTACASSKTGSGSSVGSAASSKTGSGSSAGSAASSKTGSGSSAGSLTAAQAQMVAEKGHLTSADLPGYTEKTGTNNRTDPSDATLARCIGVQLPAYTFHDPGVELHKGDALEVDSSIDVVAQESDVKASVDAFNRAKAPSCFEQQFRAFLQQHGAANSSLRVTHVPVHVSGADVSFGLRLTGTFVVQGRPLTISAYQYGAGVGQAEVGVTLSDVGDAPTAGAPSEAQLTALLQKSVDRVAAAYPG